MMEIREVTWRGMQNFSMPAPEFAATVLGSSDAIAWDHWSTVQVAFAGITQSASEWSEVILDHFNDAEMAEYEKLSR